MKPGVYLDLPNAQYHGGPGFSKSHLDQMARGPRVYWHSYINPNRPPREEKDAWDLGSATHCAMLEPDLYGAEFHVEPELTPAVPKRPTSRQINAKSPSADSVKAIEFWNEFDSRAAGRTILTHVQHETAWTIAKAVAHHPKAGPLMKRLRAAGGLAEVSYYAVDPATGALVKCRFDFHAPPSMADVKTTKDASPAKFARSVHDYRYGIQEAWYRKVYKLVTGEDFGEWMFLAVDSAAPHQIGLYTLPRDYVAGCLRIAEQNLREIVDARALDYWPDHAYDGPIELDIPRWAKRAVGMDSPEDDFEGLED